MSTATLDALGLTPPAAVGEGQAAGVLWSGGALDTGGWPATGPWSMIRRDVETGARVPLLRVPHLERNAYHRMLCIALSRGLINKNDMHLGKWVQEDDGPRPRIGPGGALAWHHRDMLDFAQHYADYTDTGDKPKKCCTTTFWNRLRKLRGIGLVFWVERSAGADRPARYEVCVRADSPLLRNLPEDLAAALHLGTLSRLLGEHEVPEAEVSGAALGRIVEAYGGAQLEPEQAADAAVVSLMGKHEIAMLHAMSREQEETVARLALAASRGWADADARPAGATPPPARRPSPVPQARPEFSVPGRPLPAGLKENLARLVGIKRAVIRGADLATLGPLVIGPTAELKTLPITEMGLTPYGLSPAVSRGVAAAQKDGRSKTKAAPAARTINSGAAFGLAAWGRPVVEGTPVVAPRGPLRAKFTPAELAEAERVARQVWAIFRDRRPTQILLGQWVTGPGGLAVWEAGDGWDGLIRLIARCLRRFAVSAVIDHAAASVSEGVRDPVSVLCNRLWRVSRRLDAYAHRPDRSKPAEHVQVDQELDPREQGRRHQARVAGAAQDPSVVAAGDSSSAEALRKGQDRLRAQTGQWREKAKPITVTGPHRAWVDDSTTPAIPRPSLEQVEADLAELAQQSEAEARPEPWHITAEASRRVAAEAAEVRAAIQPAASPAPRPSSEQVQAAAEAKRQADRDAAAVRTPAQQAARDALRRALKGE